MNASRKTESVAEQPAEEGTTKVITLADHEVGEFYGLSTSQAYRLKSNLIGSCMEEIGMGKYEYPS